MGEETFADFREAVGIGAEGFVAFGQHLHRGGDRFGHGAVDHDRGGVTCDGENVNKWLARAQAGAVCVIDGEREPDGFARLACALECGLGMGKACHGFADDQIAALGKFACHFGVERHGDVMGGVDVGAVAGDQRPDAAGDAACAMGGAGGLRLGQCQGDEGGELPVQRGAGKPVVVDGIAVGGGDGGPCGEVIGMHRLHDTRMIDHDLRGPQRRGAVAGAVDQFLPHATVEECDLGHARILWLAGSQIGPSGITVAG